MRKSFFFCICENKDADQLRSNCAADQRLCFRYTDSTIPLLPDSKFQVSSYILWLCNSVCVGPGRKHRRPVFSQRGSDDDSYILGVRTLSVFTMMLSAQRSGSDFLTLFFCLILWLLETL